MSTDLLRQLQLLESEYPGQPLIAQQADLRAINALRAQLGMCPVDARLCEIGTPVEEAKPAPVVAAAPDHSAARAIYQAYLDKEAMLAPHREYAERVARATSGPGQTPVRPLATMGTGGGPLLCDQCGKAIILEGGRFHGVPADVAWRQDPRDNWNSWILGGLVVEIQTNGTLRIYHGYPGRQSNYCCNVASRRAEKAEEEFERPPVTEPCNLLQAFFEHEFPEKSEKERWHLLNDVINTLYGYDPGIGVNRPTPENE